MEYQVLYEDYRKSLGAGRKKNKNDLPSVCVWRSAKEPLCRVPGRLALGKEFLIFF